MQAAEVINFWRDAGRRRWFAKDPTFDDMCELAFGEASDAAAEGQLEHWLEDPEGALALVILLDQMPRNIHRGTPKAYASDPLAREYARKAIDSGFDEQFEAGMRRFFYLSFSHSENPEDQALAVELNRTIDEPDADTWAVHHQQIIERFGRFPHRNAILCRQSTDEEAAYLAKGGYQ